MIDSKDVIEKFSTEESYQVFLNQPKFWASSITWVLIGTSTFAIGWFIPRVDLAELPSLCCDLCGAKDP